MDWLALSPTVLVVLFLVALLAGFIDSIAGGGGLLTLPALLAAGLSPAQALGTNKLQSVGGSFSASLYFVRRKVVNLSEQKLAIACTFFGAVAGTLLIQHLDPGFLRKLLPLLIIGIGVYFLITPSVGNSESTRRLSFVPFALIAGGGVGFYDGFFGPGAGSFYALAFVMLWGLNLAKATAHAKVLNFTSNVASLLFFIIGGKVVWAVGLVMLIGQVIGARLGASLVLSRGQKLIRPMIILVSLIMSIKLLNDNYQLGLLSWLG